MTLVYERVADHPVTHAFVVGCGRYPGLSPDRLADRQAPVEGALAITRMLMHQRDGLVAPLGSIELLLSEPLVAAGATDVASRLPGALQTMVDAADEQSFRRCGDVWLDRIRPGDCVVFYFSGHGIADGAGTAVGLLEDVKTSTKRPWAQSFNVTSLILAMRTTAAESVWVFFDACQEIAEDYAKRLWEVKNVDLKELTLTDVVLASCQAVALAGASVGELAWAPVAAEPPYFTQVLLKGLSGCCVEKTRDHGWAVTGRSLLFDLVDVGIALLDQAVRPQSLAPFSERKTLLAVPRPFTPVAVCSAPETHLRRASSITLMHGDRVIERSVDSQFVWRLDVDLEDREITVVCESPEGSVSLASQTFRQQPPGHKIVLVPNARAA